MPKHIDHNYHLRDSGVTTRQIINTPLNTVYVWVNNNLRYPQLIAVKCGREDVIFVPPSWLKHEKLRGYTGEITLDHATILTDVELEAYHKWKAWKEKSIEHVVFPDQQKQE